MHFNNDFAENNTCTTKFSYKRRESRKTFMPYINKFSLKIFI